MSKRNTITLLYGVADREHNQAVVLRDLLPEAVEDLA